MGRSKFPGKPPKTVTRKRIKVLGRPDTAHTTDSVTFAENIYYGLSLVNETLGDNEKEPPFHGFSSKEAKLSVSYIKTKHRDDDQNVERNSDKIQVDSQSHPQQSENNTVETDENSSNKDVPQGSIESAGKNDDEEVKNKPNKPKVCKRVRFKTVAGTPVLKSVNNILDRHQRTRQLRNSTAKRLLQRAKFNIGTNNRGNCVTPSDKTSNVRKFILPMRSAHSSRVIKPNKRFIEELEERTNPDNDNDSKNPKKVKVMAEKMNNTENIDKTRKEIKQTKHKWRKNITNVHISNSKSVEDTQTQKERKTHNSSKIKITLNQTTQDDKQLLVPGKALPDSDVPFVESSRIQTRSGAQSETLGLQNYSETSQTSNISPDDSSINPGIMTAEESEEVEERNDDEFDSDSELSERGSDQSNHSEDEQSEWTGMKLDGGKVILRKARLKLDNKNSGGTEGPFSVTNPQNVPANQTNPGITGTVKCGVCGAVRFYRFVKQARKFGIHSCESCRKFISKIIKRQACANASNKPLPILQCHKGDGLCLVPPVVRSQQWNLMRCVYKARCPACWLKMCLKCYHIPTTLKAGLNALLPPLMRDPVISLGTLGQDDNDVLGQKTIGSMSWPSEDSLEKNLFKSAMSWNGIDISKEGIGDGNSTKKEEKFHSLTIVSTEKKRKKDNRIKVRKKVKNPVVPLPSAGVATQGSQVPVVRQRIDLKGPRVKHVCRSASVALGQPIATFPANDGKDETDANKIVPKTYRDEDKSDKREEITKQSQKANQENNANSNHNVQHSNTKRNKNQQSILAPNHQVVRALPKPAVNTAHTISIDFWEQYDPAEVGAKGFALIGSEDFHIPAICFLCGSAGKEPLIHCQCCCEPYHAFCLEPSEWNACAQPNWCCPRCTICQTCHLRVGPKLSCIRCRQSFHHACLSKSGVNARLYSPDTPYVCQSCVKCKSCGSEGVNLYVGNLPLCSMCFKLRQRGNYCPLCQRCYNKNDFDSKMMECNECSCWVHARCEGLSDEFYQVLSYLPDSIEFTCSQCSPNPNSVWRNAIESELKAGFISVIKALSKNRKMCAALKWSPRKECLCKVAASARRLDFSDDKYTGEYADDPEESDKPSDTIVDSKIDPLSRFDFEIEDQPIDLPRRGLRRLKQRFHLKECSVRVKNCIVLKDNQEDTSSQESSSTGENQECHCSEQQILARPSPTLISVKRKVNGNEYRSLLQFHCDMEHVVNRASADNLIESYHKSLQEVFPWFDPKRSKISSSGSGLSTPSKDPSMCLDSPICPKLDDSILETWKEEVLKAPKAIAAKTGNLYSNIVVEDTRCCALCKSLGDGQGTREGRLLYCGQNEWVHSNCALWSNEVFEEIDGSLQNVHNAISRGRQIRCSECGKKGASIGCCAKNCSTTYHFPCARNAGLGFNDDKTIFCTSHLSNCITKTPHNNDDFELKRLVYVEIDRKKKKFVDPNHVRVMIGSLMIDCLGIIVPEFSDSPEKILPTNYKCSRLYWSTVNPMKIVKYYIRTYVQHCTTEVTHDAEHNVTIDHSKELEREERQKLEQLVVKQTLDAVIDSVYNKEVDENLAEQNNTDLLPPEITDVIFQDLPHDLLDGISMQDIFPKMSYEDFLAMDMRNDGVFGNDLLKDDILSSDVDEIIKPSENKVAKVDPTISELSQNDLWLHLGTKGCVQEFMDDVLNSKGPKMGGRELKRSKSEVIGNNPLLVGGQRHHQRSCSLTWSCKLDGTYGPTMKRRKIPRPAPASRAVGETNLTVMEPPNDRTSVFHELRIPESIMLTVGRANTPSIIGENNKDHKRLLWHTRQQPRIVQVDGPADAGSASECSSPEYNIEDRIPQIDGTNDETSSDNTSWFSFRDKMTSTCPAFSQNYSNQNKLGDLFHDESSNESFKIPQLDGADDVSSDDEPSQNHQQPLEPCTPIAHIGDGPVTCKRCQCTYRTQDSYNRHLMTCDIVTMSDSDSETIDHNKGSSPNSRFSDSVESMSPQFITMSPSEGHTMTSEYPDMQVTSPLEASVPSPHPAIQIEPIAQALITPQMHTHSTVETLHQTVLTSNEVIVQTQYTRTTTTLPNSAVLPQDNMVQITEVTDLTTPDERTLPHLPPGIADTIANSQSLSPRDSSMSTCGIADGAQINLQSPKTTKPKSPRTPKPRTKLIKPQIMRNSIPQQVAPVRYQTVPSATPVLQLQQTQRPTPPTVILQQVPGSGLMSYVETLQQQSGQNVQYITAIGGQEASYKPQFITTNQLVPGTYIQAGSDNLLALQNGGISVLPGVQLAQPQPTVLGTIIQQQPSTIQCGVISSEQLVLSSTPTLEMFTDSTGSMFVSSQPMYYGLETIVSNTVMSSSQFMAAGAVPQVLASSYQTTTQVFQASKLMEPLVDVQAVPNVSNVTGVQTVQSIPAVSNIRGGYVVVNPNTPETIPPPQISVPSSLSSTHPQSHEQVTPFIRPADTPHCPLTAPVIEPVRPVPAPAPAPVPAPTPAPAPAPEIRPVQQPPFIAQTSTVPSQPRPTVNTMQQALSTIPRVAVRPSPISHTVTQSNHGQWKIPEPLYAAEQTITNTSRPYLDSKHVSENTSMIKSSISSKISPLSNHSITQRDIHMNRLNLDVNSIHSDIYNTDTTITNNDSTINSVISSHALRSNPVTPPTRPMNRVLPMQATIPKQEIIKPVEKPEVIVAEPTKPVPKSAEETVTLEIVKLGDCDAVEKLFPLEKPSLISDDLFEKPPIQEDVQQNEISERNLVVIEEKVVEETPEKLVTQLPQKIPELVKIDKEEEQIEVKSGKIEESKENFKVEIDEDKLKNASLKIVLQKQLQDGSYKISHNMKSTSQSRATPKITSVEILPSKQPPQIASLQLLPIKTFTLKTNKIEEKPKLVSKNSNLPEPKLPPVAVKKPRFIAKNTKSSPIDSPTVNNNTQKKNGPTLMYEIKSQDGFTHTASSMTEVWDTVFQAVQLARKAHNLPPITHNPLTEHLGLDNNATVYLVEQLPGVNRCTKYKPRFHNLSPPAVLNEDLLVESNSGAARAEPFKGRKVHDIFSWLASTHRQQPKMIAISENEMRKAASTNLPMAMRFRILKETSKESVGVYHSHIHGRGLFSLRDIEAGEMVIEYAGEVIRASLTDKREKYYDSKHIGCYMFKIDDHVVVDATMKGNAARFINHSCEPNCYSRVVDILGKKHILIFALRRIAQGEELTYDYKFPFEDIKIPCTCGSRRCRKYLN
ncbi:histone-lysine N-methyltransferase trithorax [Fopius arisanus]|uniref:Histone-lysine N-methyltransferase trithorax n=1 Tax=Fopius arisanus TaxID=64838 RepID=A0A9R1SW17_9HYME|nr:PREDICTED: histone-lysine N-methyltransferase trithorax [Fopius arisanus]